MLEIVPEQNTFFKGMCAVSQNLSLCIILIGLLVVYVCVHVCAHVCIYVCAHMYVGEVYTCVCMYVEDRSKCVVSSSITLHIFMSQVFSLNLELTDTVGITGQQAPGFLLSPALGLRAFVTLPDFMQALLVSW